MKPKAEYILATLIKLLADQEGVDIKFEIERREADEQQDSDC